jgi:hypothetical protein
VSEVTTHQNYPALATRTERVPTGDTQVDRRLTLPLHFAFKAALQLGSAFDDLKRSIYYGQAKDPSVIMGKLGDVQGVEVAAKDLELVLTPEQYRMLHAAFGLVTEAVEFLETVAKNITDGVPIDPVNIMEECSDLDWYMAIPMNLYGFTIEQTLQANIAKLKVRYPNKFSLEAAVNRDLEAERSVLEQHSTKPPENPAGS